MEDACAGVGARRWTQVAMTAELDNFMQCWAFVVGAELAWSVFVGGW
jgi:hypothetical protein